MLLKNSRYYPPRRYEADDGGAPFSGIQPRAVRDAPGVIEHTVQLGQRLDWLAWHYYNDSRLWWLILDANPDLLFAGDLLLDDFAGQLLLIPQSGGQGGG